MATHESSTTLRLLSSSSLEDITAGLNALLSASESDLRATFLEGVSISSAGQIVVSDGPLKKTVPNPCR